MPGLYDLRRSNGQYDYVLRAANGQVLIVSERYTSKAGAENGIASTRVNAPSDARYQRLTSRDNKPYFVLRAANNEVLGTSETYSSEVARENGIASTKENAPTAPVRDST
jgi:uncharacterized protein YegP (UPF0339 family)